METFHILHLAACWDPDAQEEKAQAPPVGHVAAAPTIPPPAAPSTQTAVPDVRASAGAGVTSGRRIGDEDSHAAPPPSEKDDDRDEPGMRIGESASASSSSTADAPVPPLDPSDGASETWSARRASFESAQTWTGGRGSPVPSSTTSQMYRIRESAWSEWTWTRPMENWEREQLRVLASVIAVDGDSEPAVPLPGSPPAEQRAPEVVSPKGARAIRSLRHQSFGEMKAMRTVIPDAPAGPRDYVRS